MVTTINAYDQTMAVDYHHGQFPPSNLDLNQLVEPLSRAQDAVSRYDQMLLTLPNSELMLAPLRHAEAVVSSRMEGTISTVDDVMMYEAQAEGGAGSHIRNDTLEVHLYAQVLLRAQDAITAGEPINEGLIKNAHRVLLSHGRGAALGPGEYKTKQNYIGDDRRKIVHFRPISPLYLQPAMTALLDFLDQSTLLPLFKTAIAHVEFEALHPFNDGNGRIGRLLITLLMWKFGLIHKPYFYVSAFLEQHKDRYIELMRGVSRDNDWTHWVAFFLEAIASQAETNLTTAQDIVALYDEMKPVFREISGSKWHVAAQDFMFETPVFTNRQLIKRSGMPKHVAMRITKLLLENTVLREMLPAAGRRGALYMFEPLMGLVRA